jgi:tRNA-2-methylthio-N6-dimethylallyladenosine synthase
MKYFLETYGLPDEKGGIRGPGKSLREIGWIPRNSDEANLILINTCSVRDNRKRIERGANSPLRGSKKTRSFVLAVTGCMAERLKDEGCAQAQPP